MISTLLRLPENNQYNPPYEQKIRTMLREIYYVEPNANLGKIVRNGCRKEWSYFYDSIINVFSGKISNFDAITTIM